MSKDSFDADLSVEVTREDFQKHQDESKSSRRFRFRNLLPKKPTSFRGDLSDGNLSVAALTVTSIDTIKASNRSRRAAAAAAAAKKKAQKQEKAPSLSGAGKGFGKFRKKVLEAVRKTPEEDRIQPSSVDKPVPPLLSSRSRSDIPRKTTTMTPTKKNNKPTVVARVSSDPRSTLQRRIELDDAIRGRMDGMDVLSLGPARMPSCLSPPRKKKQHNDLDRYIATMNPTMTYEAIVMDMIHTSAGRESAEMVLESFMPGDRWMVRREEEPLDDMLVTKVNGVSSRAASPVPTLSPTDEDECGSSISCVECGDEDLTSLMGSMWGAENKPPPTHTQAQNISTNKQQDEDDIMQLASACNVPIDIDEDTFIIETAHHLHSIHEIAAVPLRRGDYDTALTVFEKILKGLQLRHEDNPHHLIGTTLHNIGVILMWLGRFPEALYSFMQAVSMRRDSLPSNHPDIAVSLVRQGFAHLALDQVEEAIDTFTNALDLCPIENATRAKVLNNLGAVQYMNRNSIEAAKSFTAALELQRKQLVGPIRRETIIFDATTTLSNMGKLYLEKQDLNTAFFVYDEALLLQTTAFRKDSPLVLQTTGNLAYARAKNNDHIKAIHLYTNILECHTPSSREYAEIMGILGILYGRQEDYDAALSHLNVAHQWNLDNHDNDSYHTACLLTKESIKKVEKKLQGASVWV